MGVKTITDWAPHPYADRLELIFVEGEGPVVVPIDTYNVGDSVVWAEPGYVIHDKVAEYLGVKNKIKARNIRGIVSRGLVFKPFDDPDMNVLYEPFEGTKNNDVEPCHYTVGYDIDRLEKVREYFKEGEDVWVAEKLHGTFVAVNNEGKVYSKGNGSKGLVFKETANNLYTFHTRKYAPLLKEGEWLMGEIYGPKVQNLKYDLPVPRFAAFDLWSGDKFLDYVEFTRRCNKDIPMVPILGIQPFNEGFLREEAEEDSLIANQLMEGLVIRPMKERMHNFNRVIAKIISKRYKAV